MTELAASIRLFDDVPERPPSWLGLRWWVTAVILHLCLLGVLSSWERRPAPESSSVEVRLEPPRPRPSPPIPERLGNPAPVLDALPARPPSPSVRSPGELHGATTERMVERPAREEPALDRQVLMDAVAAMEWTPQAPAAVPGRRTDSATLERLNTPVLPRRTNRFDGMSAPSETEITDRWMSPGGVHHVVIRGPDGNDYCGRQASVDDFRPWLQMPMMFHPCGGGGRRKGGGSWRNN